MTTKTSAPPWGVVGRRLDRLGGSLSLLVVVAIAGCGAGVSSHDYSSAIVRSIQTTGPEQIQRATNGPGRSGKATINAINCVQTAGTQRYSCVVHYSYENSEGTYRYKVDVSATCDTGGTCQWHLDRGGTLVGAEPD
ncbi:MAG: hypothetical protein ACTHQQ_12880 [Solirubrobacteraceae bacterium]